MENMVGICHKEGDTIEKSLDFLLFWYQKNKNYLNFTTPIPTLPSPTIPPSPKKNIDSKKENESLSSSPNLSLSPKKNPIPQNFPKIENNNVPFKNIPLKNIPFKEDQKDNTPEKKPIQKDLFQANKNVEDTLNKEIKENKPKETKKDPKEDKSFINMNVSSSSSYSSSSFLHFEEDKFNEKESSTFSNQEIKEILNFENLPQISPEDKRVNKIQQIKEEGTYICHFLSPLLFKIFKKTNNEKVKDFCLLFLSQLAMEDPDYFYSIKNKNSSIDFTQLLLSSNLEEQKKNLFEFLKKIIQLGKPHPLLHPYIPNEQLAYKEKLGYLDSFWFFFL